MLIPSRAPSRLLRAALDAAARGWPVFPLWPGSKRPAITGWPSQATCHGDVLARWWAAAPYNIGIACGPAGLLVIDIDDPTAATAGPLSRTYEVVTPQGRHRYYAVHSERPGRCTVGALGPRIDTRAAGGYVVAAGSVLHVMGHQRRYRAIAGGQVAAAPAWLLEALAPAGPRGPAGVALPPVAHPDRYAEAALSREANRVLHALPGTRNATLFGAASRLGRLVATGILDDRETADRLLSASTAHAGIDGFTTAEARRTIANGLRYGGRPQGPRAS